MIDFSGTFDTTNALSSMFLWVLFGYLAASANCDLQRWLRSHALAQHTVGLIAFFFLFTLLDANNKTSIEIVLFKTVLVYILFVLMIKSKWYFVVPVLALLLLDQALKKQAAFKRAQEDSEPPAWQLQTSAAINAGVVGLIVVGALHYMYLQWRQHGRAFSLLTFFSITKCYR